MKLMKLKFDANLPYQLNAIQAVVDLFDAQPLNQGDFEISFTQTESRQEYGRIAPAGIPDYGEATDEESEASQLDLIEDTVPGIGNRLVLDDETLLKNVHTVQERNDIEKTPALQGRHFSVEMETGTGKTYVYLRTIFELNKKYDFKKFIIVVPSVAIREGTLKNLNITKDHFKSIYNNVPFDYYVYNSKKVSQLRQFATSNNIQILVINIDAFRKVLDKDEKGTAKKGSVNVIHQEYDKLSGRRPIEFIQATNPIVIIDEPQSVDNTPKAQAAIATLNPLCTLRYSATHINPYNLLYKLDPVKAYDMRLVKRIEVSSVRSDDDFNEAYIKLISTDYKSSIKAKVAIHIDTKSGPKEKNFTLKQGDDLSNKSQRPGYKDGYIVQEISAEPGNEYIRFNSGKTLYVGQSQGGMTDDIMRVQIKKTIEEHLEKELRVKEHGIKALSLFFIDRVANYRSYDEDGNPVQGKIALWFEEEYKKLIKKPRYKDLIPYPLDKIHDGYFAQDKKGVLKDTKGNTQADEDVYNKIMTNKEQLLSNEEPLRFIFSHSALREGWDNPNVFQICTLNETKSEMKKRQEIGRGLRLPVNQSGERVFDDTINRLTVIANESYEDFAKKLQNEIEEDFGMKFGRIAKLAFAKLTTLVDGEELPLGADKSEQIWSELKEKGYINETGDIQTAFNPTDKYFELDVSAEFKELKPAIIDTIEGHLFSNRIVNKNNRRTLKLNKRIFLDPEFKKLWEKINKKTTYSVEYKTAVLIERTTKAIKEMEKIEPLRITVTKSRIDIDKKGVDARLLKTGIEDIEKEIRLPDILAYLQKETELTRSTLVDILFESGRLKDFPINPQRFMDLTAYLINKELHKLIIDGIKYEKIAGQEYEMRLFEEEEVIRYLDNLVDVKNSVYDAVEFDSSVERRFAQDLDDREDIKFFVKLPSWFKVDTPIGSYNPDWAIVKNGEKTLYLVRETKGTRDFEKLRSTEAQKIRCGRRHFKELEVSFDVVVKAKEV